MLITINDQPIALGEALPDAVRGRAGLVRPGLLRRLLSRNAPGCTRYETSNCLAACFTGTFDLYPCLHGYLTPDRKWRTDAHILVQNNRVTSAVLRVIEGRYAATEFVDRFRESCSSALGEPHTTDRYTMLWRNASATVTSILQPDTKNACFLFEEIAE